MHNVWLQEIRKKKEKKKKLRKWTPNATERVHEICWLLRTAVEDNVWFAISFHSFVFLLCVFITEAPRLFSPAINTSPCIALSFLSFVLLSSRSASRHFNWALPAACDCLTLGFQINMLNISSATPLHYRPDTSSPAPSFLIAARWEPCPAIS